MDTNTAYQMATQWLAAIHMDVKALSRDCKARIAVSPMWSGLTELGDVPQKDFVPIYYVWWVPLENDAPGNSPASVELYLPDKGLIQLRVDDPKYILRPPLVFTNLATLFPGVAPIFTNHPVKTIFMGGHSRASQNTNDTNK